MLKRGLSLGVFKKSRTKIFSFPHSTSYTHTFTFNTKKHKKTMSSSINTTTLRRSFPKVLTPTNYLDLTRATPVIAKVSFVGIGYCFGTRDDEGNTLSFSTLGEAFNYFDETTDSNTGFIDSTYGLGTFTSITFEKGKFYLRTGGKVRGSRQGISTISWVMSRQHEDIQKEIRDKYAHIDFQYSALGLGENWIAGQKFYNSAEKCINFAPRRQQTQEDRLRSLGHEDKAELEHLRKLSVFQAELLHELDPVPAEERYEDFFEGFGEVPDNLTYAEVFSNFGAFELAKSLPPQFREEPITQLFTAEGEPIYFD